MKYNKSVLCGLLLVLILITGCGKPQPIKIGFVGTLMGGTSNASINGRNGITLAIEQFNRSGGLNGRMVQLIVKDDKHDPTVAREVDRQLSREGVIAIIGHMTSNMTVAVINEINRMRIVLISPTSAINQLSHKDDFFIRVQSPSRQAPELLAKKMIPRFGIKKIAIVYDEINKEYSREWCNYFQNSYHQAGGRVVTTKAFSSELSLGFYNMALELLAFKADGILIIANPSDTAMLCQQIRKVDGAIPLFTAGWAVSGNIIEPGGPTVEGLVFPETIPDENNPKYQKFEMEYIRRFGTEPSIAAMMGYEAIRILLETLPKCGRFVSADLKNQIIKKHTYQGLNGEFSIDRYGDAERRYKLFTISNGKIQRLEN